MSITYVADFCTLWRENYEMNFIQFRPLVTKCLTFVAAGPGPSWLLGEKYEEFSWLDGIIRCPLNVDDGIRNSVTMECWSFCFIFLLVSRMFPRWNVVVCDTMANVWALMVCHWLLGQHSTHTSSTQMKTSRQKRPRMCQLGFLWLFPTKYGFMQAAARSGRGRGLYNVWYAAMWLVLSCYGILAPDLASVSCTGPPASHLLAHNQQLRVCRGQTGACLCLVRTLH